MHPARPGAGGPITGSGILLTKPASAGSDDQVAVGSGAGWLLLAAVGAERDWRLLASVTRGGGSLSLSPPPKLAFSHVKGYGCGLAT